MKLSWPKLSWKTTKGYGKQAVVTAALSTIFNGMVGIFEKAPEERVDQTITGNKEVVISNRLEETPPLHWTGILAVGAGADCRLLV